MPLRCWRFRLAYRAVFLICISWYAVQLIQTCFLSSQEENPQLRYKFYGTRELPEQSYQLTNIRKMESSETQMQVEKLVSGETHIDNEKDLMVNLNENYNRLEGGSQRKLNDVVETRKHIQEDIQQESHIFIQTNLSGMVIQNISAVQSIPRPAVIENRVKYPLRNGYEKQRKKSRLAVITPVPVGKIIGAAVEPVGEMGTAVELSVGDVMRSKEIFPLHQFDSVVSDKIGLNRSLPDDRPPRCKSYRYPTGLPSTSIIIAFHNEAKSTFLRTIHSIVNRSPRHLITEVILVNDASNLGDWHQTQWLHDYLANFSIPIQLLHSPERIGLVGARMLGLSKVSNMSDVVTFLDSHCECTDGWLEPLLHRIAYDRTRVVSPVIDAIDDHTFEYISTISWPHIGGFSWFPEFMWIRVPPEEKKRVYGDFSLPLRTPTISGGLFAIDKSFFQQLGFYDPGLKIWGGENLELSFKVWQCGGSLEIIPCSRVGHVFRDTTPYSFLGDPEHVFLRNNRRIIETWAQEYSHIFYALTPKYREVQYGSIEDRLQIKESLKCNDFHWYLKHVYPGHILPHKYLHLGQIVNKQTSLCLDNSAVGEKKKLGSRVTLNHCKMDDGMNQVVMLNSYDQLQHDRYCLTPQGEDNFVSLELCALGKTTNARRQEWIFYEKNNHIVHARTKQCLTRSPGTNFLTDEKQFVMIQNCSETDKQNWILKSIPLTRYHR